MVALLSWKEVIHSFGLIGARLVWRVGNGGLVWVSLDPWMGFGGSHILSVDLRLFLVGMGIIFLSNMDDPVALMMWHQGWVSGYRLGMTVELSVEWSNYLAALRNSHIRL